MKAASLSGVFAPVLTPFDATLAPDASAFAGFCRWILSQGAGLAIFGTNSEANSLSVAEKLDLLDSLLGAGLPAGRMMPGTGACALSDAVTLCGAAARARTAAVLMLPPFYYKGVSDDGLFAFYAETIERVGSANLKICLYHIPPVAHVPIPLSLIERLIRRYPETVIGIKDSGGDFSHTKAMLDAFPGFRVFCGSEVFLRDTMLGGGAGCISASANVNPAAIVAAFQRYDQPDGPDRQASLAALRRAYDGLPMIPALKRTVAGYGARPGFATVRPPLVALGDDAWATLSQRLAALDLVLPELAEMLTPSGEGSSASRRAVKAGA
ncbi:dihydrodipicolinate synthase family protein [soil metagenome]